MVQIIQSGPSPATLRQQAMDQALQGVIQGVGAYQAQEQNKRQMAMAEEAVKRQQDQADLQNILALSQQGIQDPRLALEQAKNGRQIITPAMEAQPAQYGGEMQGPVQPGQGPLRALLSEAKPAAPAVLSPDYLNTYTARKQAEIDFKKSESERARNLQGLQTKKLEQELSYAPEKRRLEESEKNANIQKIKAQTNAALDSVGANKLDKKIIETQAVDTAKSVSGLSKVKAAMDNALVVMNDPTVSQDQKIKTGQSLFKLLNSAEGSDAVGAEEARRIGSFLEFNLANFTQPGAFFGRDVDGFIQQIGNYSSLLGERIVSGNKSLEDLRKGILVGQGGAGQPTQITGSMNVPKSEINRVMQTMSREQMIQQLQGGSPTKVGAR